MTQMEAAGRSGAHSADQRTLVGGYDDEPSLRSDCAADRGVDSFDADRIGIDAAVGGVGQTYDERSAVDLVLAAQVVPVDARIGKLIRHNALIDEHRAKRVVEPSRTVNGELVARFVCVVQVADTRYRPGNRFVNVQLATSAPVILPGSREYRSDNPGRSNATTSRLCRIPRRRCR